MTLKQLQAEWRIYYADSKIAVWNFAADDLAPHILQQERDTDLIRRLYDALPPGTSDIAITKLWGEVRSRLKEMAG